MEKKYEAEEGTVEHLIEDELFRAFASIDNLDPSSEEYTRAVNNIDKLHSLWMDEEKVGLEYADRIQARSHELNLEQMKIDAKKVSDDTEYQIKRLEVIEMHKVKGKDVAQMAIDFAKTVIPIGALVGITVLGWHNENNPIKPLMVTSNTTRNSTGILGKFIK